MPRVQQVVNKISDEVALTNSLVQTIRYQTTQKYLHQVHTLIHNTWIFLYKFFAYFFIARIYLFLMSYLRARALCVNISPDYHFWRYICIHF